MCGKPCWRVNNSHIFFISVLYMLSILCGRSSILPPCSWQILSVRCMLSILSTHIFTGNCYIFTDSLLSFEWGQKHRNDLISSYKIRRLLFFSLFDVLLLCCLCLQEKQCYGRHETLLTGIYFREHRISVCHHVTHYMNFKLKQGRHMLVML